MEQSPDWSETEREFLVQELQASFDDLINTVSDFNEEQVTFRESEERWNILEIIEHQELQDQLFYRELTILTQYPEMDDLLYLATDIDDELLDYATVTSGNKASAPWYLEPRGRYCKLEDALSAFGRQRLALIKFIKTTDKNLRKYVSPGGRGNAAMRDLHQLMLVNIAHTNRHWAQLKNIPEHPDFPIIQHTPVE